MPAINLGPAKRIADILRPPDPPKTERTRDPKPPKPPKPERPPKPPTDDAEAIGAPQGKVAGAPANNGVPWSSINRYDDLLLKWGKETSLDIARKVKAMIVVESGGTDIVGGQAGSTGILQIMPRFWTDTATTLGVSLQNPEGQIAVACAILAGTSGHGNYGGWEANFRRLYFPHDDPISGVTQDDYVAWITTGSALIAAAATGTSPAPQPKDLFAAIFGGLPYTVITTHNEPTNLGYYNYYQGHGGDPWHHPGYDLGAPLGTTLYAPFTGTVTCVGTDRGPGSWQQSCAAFAFVSNFSGAPPSGVGRVELLHEDGKRSLIYGHCLECLVKLGQTVQPGTPVARLGGMNSAHVHLEARRWLGSDYTIVDPKVLFGDAEGGVAYASRLPISQAGEFETSWTIRVTSKRTPVLQYAGSESPKVAADLVKGEDFQATYLMIGLDGTPYWISKASGRVPMAKDAAERFKELLLA